MGRPFPEHGFTHSKNWKLVDDILLDSIRMATTGYLAGMVETLGFSNHFRIMPVRPHLAGGSQVAESGLDNQAF
jgi:hypothetical protein